MDKFKKTPHRLNFYFCCATQAIFLLFICCIGLIGCRSKSQLYSKNAPTIEALSISPGEIAKVPLAKIGIAPCDTYLIKYHQCLDKVADPARQAMEKSLLQTQRIWKKISSTPDGKQGLAQTCEVVLEKAKRATAKFGCDCWQ